MVRPHDGAPLPRVADEAGVKAGYTRSSTPRRAALLGALLVADSAQPRPVAGVRARRRPADLADVTRRLPRERGSNAPPS
jgi:hypothetical protein